MTPVHHVDSMGLHFLEDVVFNTRAKGIQLLVANPNRQVGFYPARHAGDDFHKARVFSVRALLDRELSFGMISRTDMCIVSPNHPWQVVNSWSRVSLPRLIGKENIFVSTHEAMIHAKASLSDLRSSSVPRSF